MLTDWQTRSWRPCPRPRRYGPPSSPLRECVDCERPRRAAGFSLRGAALLAIALLLAGCQTPGPSEAERELRLAHETIADQRNQLAAQKAAIDTLQHQINTIRHIQPGDLAKIFYPQELRIEGLSGGYDSDKQPGDEGVVVYLRPLDGQGDVLKVAGEIHIQLYGPAGDPPADKLILIGEYTIPVEESRKLWYGKLMTYHYTIRCPWLDKPPDRPEITIRATFIDYLTQRVISAQRTCTVKLPP